MDNRKIEESHVDESEQLWRLDLITTIKEIHLPGVDNHVRLLALLVAPTRKSTYTLNFNTSVIGGELRSGKSLLAAAICATCNTCLRILLNAGARATYNVEGGGCSAAVFPLSYIIATKGRLSHDGDNTVTNMVKELLIHGADVNAGLETSADHNRYVYPALTIALIHGSPVALIQTLLDNGARITETAWNQAVDYNLSNPSELCILLDHAEKSKQVIPLESLFQRLVLQRLVLREGNSRADEALHGFFLSPRYLDQLKCILSRGYVPDKNSDNTRGLFVRALRENSPDSEKMVFMILDKSPFMLQACRGLLHGITLSPKFQRLLATPPLLQSLCKSLIISTIGHSCYTDKVKELPLPPKIIRELTTAKEHEHELLKL